MELIKYEEHSYDCVMIPLPNKLKWQITDYGVNNIRPEFIDPEDGFEYNPHITVIYGLRDVDPNDLAEVIDDFGPVTFELKNTAAFHHDTKDILHIEVESSDLINLRQRIIDKFSDNITLSYPDYQPHVTIAYMKKNMSSQYTFKDEFSGLIGQIDQVDYSYDDENYEISLIGEFEPKDINNTMAVGISEEEIIIEPPDVGAQTRCPKHNWVAIGKTIPYNHARHGKHIGIKTKEMCTICGKLRWRNMNTGSPACQKDDS